ncbi:hypothetical protein [Hydrogenophaga sp. BPS33]|uniref:hypothetical protein n=1 Tax=Hydrogenophaga sp. BPS33 TaxID=2651974 RepID=UPI001357F8CE|nr:hypothetical protein [Hydrogenophaga sp. BPS33]
MNASPVARTETHLPSTWCRTVATVSDAPEPAGRPDLAPPVLTHDEYRSMTTPRDAEHLITSMRQIGGAVRMLFSRQEPERVQAVAVELAAATSTHAGLDDPVRAWEPALQTDRGLGRARRLQRLIHSPVWHSEHRTSRADKSLDNSAADYLFTAVMNLLPQAPLPDELHIFRLWYIAARAVNPPENALRLFGDLRELPPHQQLAAGARMLFTLESGLAPRGTPRHRLGTPHGVALPARK